LDRLGNIALACQSNGLIMEIRGHTDSIGAEETNQALSEQRAQAVVDAMALLGIQPDAMRAVGFGETQPIATNDTRTGRAANRRITFQWIVSENDTAPAASEALTQ